MGTGQHEGMPPFIFGVINPGQSIGPFQKLISSSTSTAAWNLQEFQLISEARVQEPVPVRKFLDVEVVAPKTCHGGE